MTISTYKNRIGAAFSAAPWVRILDICFPKTVLVAISIGCNGFLVYKSEGNGWLLANLQTFTVTAFIRLQIDPLNAVVFLHRVKYRADGYFYQIFLNRYHGGMLLLAPVCGAGSSFVISSPQHITGTPASWIIPITLPQNSQI